MTVPPLQLSEAQLPGSAVNHMTTPNSPTAPGNGRCAFSSARLSEAWGADEDIVRLGSCSSEWLDDTPTAAAVSSTLPAGQTALPWRLVIPGADSFSSSNGSSSAAASPPGMACQTWGHRASGVTKVRTGTGGRLCKSCDVASCCHQQQLWSRKPAAAGAASVAAGSAVQHRATRQFQARCSTPQHSVAGTPESDDALPCAGIAGQHALQVVSDASQQECHTTEPHCMTHTMLDSLELVSPVPLAPKQRAWGPRLGGGSAASILPALGDSGCCDMLPNSSLHDVAVTPACAGSTGSAAAAAAASARPVSKWIGTWRHLDQSRPDRQGVRLTHLLQHSSTGPCAATGLHSGSSSQAGTRSHQGGSPVAVGSVAGGQQQPSASSPSPVWLSLDSSCQEEEAEAAEGPPVSTAVLQAAVSALEAEKAGLEAHLAEMVEVYHSQQEELQEAEQQQAELKAHCQEVELRLIDAHFDREELEGQLAAQAANAAQQAAVQEAKHRQQVKALQQQVQELLGLLSCPAGLVGHPMVVAAAGGPGAAARDQFARPMRRQQGPSTLVAAKQLQKDQTVKAVAAGRHASTQTALSSAAQRSGSSIPTPEPRRHHGTSSDHGSRRPSSTTPSNISTSSSSCKSSRVRWR